MRRTEGSQRDKGVAWNNAWLYEPGTQPFTFLGPVTYVEHHGERPVAFTWKLPEQMPEELFEVTRSVAAAQFVDSRLSDHAAMRAASAWALIRSATRAAAGAS